ncbi:hypothetical protein [Bacillus sp. 165]|uniref:hypothetical protein n=1 Tax=Bacillus sp. 165 TaxID=1529117 RepID=UPI001ADB5E1E|nr:hypothetical protein [Bacillus sp. 165]MBO9129884.1 hypothetical protein [Bacillus sp. 165]
MAAARNNTRLTTNNIIAQQLAAADTRNTRNNNTQQAAANTANAQSNNTQQTAASSDNKQNNSTPQEAVRNEASIKGSGNSHVNLNVNVDNSALAYALTSLLRANNTINENQFDQILKGLKDLTGNQQIPASTENVLGVSAEQSLPMANTLPIRDDVPIQDAHTGSSSSAFPRVTMIVDEDDTEKRVNTRKNTAPIHASSSNLPTKLEGENFTRKGVPLFEKERLSTKELEAISDKIVINHENKDMAPELKNRPQKDNRKRHTNPHNSPGTRRTFF